MDLSNPFSQRPRRFARLPRLVRLFIVNGAIGFAMGAFFTVGVLYADIAGIGGLVSGVSGGWLAAAVFAVLNGIVFSGVQISLVVMSMPYPGDSPRGGLQIPEARPMRVRADRRR